VIRPTLLIALILTASCSASNGGSTASKDGGPAGSDAGPSTCSPFTVAGNDGAACSIVQPCGLPCPGDQICNLDGACVTARYTPGDGTVTDEMTGLVWQEPVSALPCPTVSANGCTWDGAQAYCSALTLGGFSAGWRLPTVTELYSLIEDGMAPKIDATAFPNTGVWFWTSSPYPGYPGNAWMIGFDDGNTYELLVRQAEGVRCVR
jgi:hypothetical protein